MSIDLLPIAYARTSKELHAAIEGAAEDAYEQGLVVYSTRTSFTGRLAVTLHVSGSERRYAESLPDESKIVARVRTREISTPKSTSGSVYIAKK